MTTMYAPTTTAARRRRLTAGSLADGARQAPRPRPDLGCQADAAQLGEAVPQARCGTALGTGRRGVPDLASWALIAAAGIGCAK
jgi:hypothetical protein